MRRIFDVGNIVQTYVRVEAALVCALEKLGIADPGCCESVKRVGMRPDEVYEMERRIGHDIASLAFILEERSGCRFVHFGATSYDIVDTTWAILIRDGAKILLNRLESVGRGLKALAERFGGLVMVGRTHGQWAQPVTLGFKLGNYAYELAIGVDALSHSLRWIRGKVGGAVGTGASWGDKLWEIRRLMSSELGIQIHEVSTQVAPRESFAYLASALSLIAATAERFSIEVRELSRPEIGEWVERGGGSSAMPHKANPTRSERITSLARLVRHLASLAYENVQLWHERDLSNSANERVWIPHIFLAVDQILLDWSSVLNSLHIDADRIGRNVEAARHELVSEAVMNMLIMSGSSRVDAYYAAQVVETDINPRDYIGEADKLARLGFEALERSLDNLRNVLNT